MADHSAPLRAPAGTHDVLWPESARWERLVAEFARRAQLGGFGLVLNPMFEDAQLFRRGIGDESDVVRKEMYEFADRGGRDVALRPEGTASVVRAFVQHRPPATVEGVVPHPRLPLRTAPGRALQATPPARGGGARHRRPRRRRRGGDHGRRPLRLDGAAARSSWRSTPWVARDVALPTWPRSSPISTSTATSCVTSTASVTAPIRCAVLDCKSPECRAVTDGAPRITDYLDEACGAHFARVRQGLDDLAVAYRLEPRLVRGLDYYTRTTFEFSAGSLTSAQNAVGGGGRYDGLAEALGGPPTPGIGFGIGIERLLLACDAEGVFAANPPPPDAFVVDVTGGAAARALCGELRRAGLGAVRAYDGRSLKAQLKQADRSGARYALIVGPEELAGDVVTAKPLRAEGPQETVARAEVARWLAARSTTSDTRDTPGQP